MEILALTSDEQVINFLSSMNIQCNISLTVCSSLEDEIEGLSKIYSANPGVLILDDDFIKPNSLRYIQSLKKTKKKIKIIFLTSDNSVEFGRQIIGNEIAFYAIKPLEDDSIKEYIKSVSKQIESFN